MNKNELIGAVAESCGLSKTDASNAVEGVFDSIQKALANGDEGRLGGFVFAGLGVLVITPWQVLEQYF